MIETVKNWIVESTLDVREIESFCDSETRKVLFYRYPSQDDDGGVYTPGKEDRFFNTEDAARAFVAERLVYLKDMSVTVFNIIDEIKWIDDKVCNFDRTEFLETVSDHSGSYYMEKSKKYSAICRILKQFIQTGMLMVNSFTFSKDEVKRVKWYNDDHALLVLKDDSTVMTRTAAEYELVCTVFGDNISGMVYTASFGEDGKVVNNKK